MVVTKGLQLICSPTVPEMVNILTYCIWFQYGSWPVYQGA